MPTLNITSGDLTSKGEGNDAQTKYIHWPNTSGSGVTVGKGYDIGSRTAQSVITDLTTAGMSQTQASKISKGVGLKGSSAGTFVTNNKTDIGEIDPLVQTRLLANMLVAYTAQALDVATNKTPSKDESGYYTNASGRELNDKVSAGTYCLSTQQWGKIHPALIELLTDLKYQGGYYLYDRIAQINKGLIKNDGNQVAQFKAVISVFESLTAGQLSYMDTYGKKIGEGTGNTELFYNQTAQALAGATTRRNRLRLAYLKYVLAALEAGQTVVLVPA